MPSFARGSSAGGTRPGRLPMGNPACVCRRFPEHRRDGISAFDVNRPKPTQRRPTPGRPARSSESTRSLMVKRPRTASGGRCLSYSCGYFEDTADSRPADWRGTGFSSPRCPESVTSHSGVIGSRTDQSRSTAVRSSKKARILDPARTRKRSRSSLRAGGAPPFAGRMTRSGRAWP
jgi:hypothetical protein